MKNVILIVLMAAMALPAWAEVTFNGFASIRGGVALDGEDSPLLDDIGLYNEALSFDKESLFALQASSDLGEGLSATIQMMAEGKSNYDLEARWAYLSYNLTPNSKLMAGRLVNPIFSRSEYQSVGFTHPYARLPKSVYFPFDFNVLDGLSWNSNYAVGAGDLTVKAALGNWNGTVPLSGVGDFELRFENLMHLSANYAWNGFSVFAGGFQTDVKADDLSEQNVGATLGLSNFGLNPTQVQEVASVIQLEGLAAYVFYGFSMDYMNILLDYEYATYEVKDTGDAKNDSYFISAGYRLGDYTVVAHIEDYAHDKDGNVKDAASLTDAQSKAVATSLLTTLASRQFNGSGVTVKYDFHPQAVLKVDYFMYENDPNVGVKEDSSGMSVGIDMMF